MKNKITRIIKMYFGFILDVFCFFSSFIIYFLDNNTSLLLIIGLFIIFISILLCAKFTGKKYLVLMFGIIAFINISLAYTDCIKGGSTVATWQIALRSTKYNIISAKSILIFMSIFNLIFSNINNNSLNKSYNMKISRKKNVIIASVGLLFTYFIFIQGVFSNSYSSSTYVSNNNTLYEYIVLIYILVWFYSKDIKIINFLLIVLGISYILFSLYYGDRSAAFLLLLLMFLLYINIELSVKKILFLAISALLLSNMVSIFRNAENSDLESIINNTIDKGLYSDTVSYSNYTGITLTKLYEIEKDNKYTKEYIKSIILGTSKTDYANLAVYARNNYKNLFNRGGGLYPHYIYCLFGSVGLFIISLFTSYILKKIFFAESDYAQLLQILITCYSIRWYLYNPINLFRSILLIFSILYFLCFCFNKFKFKMN